MTTRSARSSWASALIGSLIGLGLAGCGSTPPAGRIPGHELTIYAAMPLEGLAAPVSLAIRAGEERALDELPGHRLGRYRIRFVVLDDANPRAGRWDPGQVTDDAHVVVSDSTALAYLGDLDSGATAVSLPILNRALVPQLGPASTAVGLTSGQTGASPGEPLKYYPTGRRTFVRVVPNDTVQAAVQASLQREAGCRRAVVLSSGGVYADELAAAYRTDAGTAAVATIEYQPGGADYSSLAASVAASAPDCVFLAATAADSAASVTEAVAAALPEAKLFGSDGLAAPGYLDPGQGGLPADVGRRITLTAPAPALGGPSPPPGLVAQGPYAIVGYETMALLLSALRRSTRGGAQVAERSKLLEALFATRGRKSPLGRYSINAAGDTTLSELGAYSISDGTLHLLRVVPVQR